MPDPGQGLTQGLAGPEVVGRGKGEVDVLLVEILASTLVDDIEDLVSTCLGCREGSTLPVPRRAYMS